MILIEFLKRAKKPLFYDEIARATGLPKTTVSAYLSMLKKDGYVTQMADNCVGWYLYSWWERPFATRSGPARAPKKKPRQSTHLVLKTRAALPRSGQFTIAEIMAKSGLGYRDAYRALHYLAGRGEIRILKGPRELFVPKGDVPRKMMRCSVRHAKSGK